MDMIDSFSMLRFFESLNRRILHLHLFVSSYLFKILNLDSRIFENKLRDKGQIIRFLRFFLIKIVSYQFLNILSEKYYLVGNKDYSTHLRSISLKKRLKVTIHDFIHELKLIPYFSTSDVEYLSLTGVENLGFFSVYNENSKMLFKIHDIKATWNKELVFYDKFIRLFPSLIAIIPHTIVLDIKIKNKRFSLLGMKYMKLIDMSYKDLDSLIHPYSILNGVSYEKYISSSSNLKIPIDTIRIKTINSLILMIKNNTVKILQDKNFIDRLELDKIKEYLKINLNQIDNSDYCLSHGDFDMGGFGGYGNKFIYENKVIFLDWSDLKFTLKGMNLIMLLRRQEEAKNVLQILMKHSLTHRLKKVVKIILLLNITLDYSEYLKISQNAKIVNSMMLICKHINSMI